MGRRAESQFLRATNLPNVFFAFAPPSFHKISQNIFLLVLLGQTNIYDDRDERRQDTPTPGLVRHLGDLVPEALGVGKHRGVLGT